MTQMGARVPQICSTHHWQQTSGAQVRASMEEEQHGSHQAAGMHCSTSTLVPAAVSAAELDEAAQLWGSRLEVGGACRQGVPKPSKEKRLGIRARLGQDAESADHLGEQRWL